ncbi:MULTISPECIES: nitrogenase stabilizing/protective protein NifW [Paraburkholderia]|uniref:Nitrogenase-stabilizing/protective protein NifW n=2 Tax=Paraburkholderia TaxID=1822464 RepID=A0ABU9SPS6_9BURK|nr:nitrogenase stabilizing/protective protein NifW [Paraburkholderia nodosa]
MKVLIDKLHRLSSAEDFFRFFAISYDDKVVDVSRLHILRRFFQYIRQSEDLSADHDATLFLVYRNLLLKAYNDFVISTPAEQKVFRVLQEADGERHISLDSLRESLPARANN